MTAITKSPDTSRVHGIHHVTCIAGDPQENADFYTRVMGMRLVKRSVNQDAPDTYHLFYADAVGTPGTDLTFFPWPRMKPVLPGIGLASEVSFAAPPDSLDWWKSHLDKANLQNIGEDVRFDEPVLTFRDPHGLHLALVGSSRTRPFTPWHHSAVPAQHQVRGIDSVRLLVRNTSDTGSFLTAVLGMKMMREEMEWFRFSATGEGAGLSVDVREEPAAQRGRWGTGGIHHVAWRVTDEAEQLQLRTAIEEAGRRPTDVIDRFWFKSVYFLEPGGVLFELATDGPGFERDESLESLGDKLILPPWLEQNRAQIEAGLQKIDV